MAYRWPITRTLFELWLGLIFLSTEYEQLLAIEGLNELVHRLLGYAKSSAKYREQQRANKIARIRGDL